MATTMVMPQLGQTMEEGTINKWFKQEGEKIEKGEPLLEVMTDKVNMEVEAPESGVLLKIIVDEGATIPVQEPIAIIGQPGESVATAPAPAAAPSEDKKEEAPVATAAPAPPPAPARETAPTPPAPALERRVPATGEERILISPRARKLAEENRIDIADLAGRGTGPEGRIVEQDVMAYLEGAPVVERVKATPMAQKLASELGVDLSRVTGTGPAGRITREDVEQAAAAAKAPAPAPAAPTVTAPVGAARIPLKGARKLIADRVSESKRQKPHVTLVTPVDMTAAVAMRAQISPEFEAKYGTKLTFNDLIVKAVAMGLADQNYRIVNSTLEEDVITMHEEVNIGIAVALEFGLIVPVLRNADKKSLAEISIQVRDMANRARNNQLVPDELAGGTFTISNLGAFGVDSFDPIIVAPQAAILGVGAITEQPAVVDGRIEVRSMMNLCISFDHRVMDGVPPAKYLQRVKQILEAPYILLV